ncbi:MAG: SDR family oxidoreductase [Dehalococcoidia bacterium]|nr:SDR family oxidoreductase [Dehalococcoidia bacterium]
MDIAGKIALITGAGSGIGRATSLMLADAGASIMVADVDEAGGRETVKALEARGAKAAFVKADVATPQGVRDMFRAVEDTFGGVDIVYNNAGVSCGNPNWPATSLDRIFEVVNINTSGVMMGTKAAVEAMATRGGGVVINTASIAADNPNPNEPIYGGTKAAVAMFTRCCARLKDTHNVRVNAVSPGMVRTEFQRKTGDGVAPADWLVPAIDRIGEAILPPEAIAQAVLDFIRDDSLAGEVRVVTNQLPAR